MQNSSKEAKKRLLVNIASNMVAFVAATLISIWLTPYYIRKLGVDVYGMIPLVISFIAYFNLFTKSIATAVSRFVAIHLGRGETMHIA